MVHNRSPYANFGEGIDMTMTSPYQFIDVKVLFKRRRSSLRSPIYNTWPGQAAIPHCYEVGQSFRVFMDEGCNHFDISVWMRIVRDVPGARICNDLYARQGFG